MVNHPNRKPVSHSDMVENHTGFYPITRSFKPKALCSQGQARIAGGLNVVSLWICVEWDSHRVLVGYHWQPAIDGKAVKAGLESWFRVEPLVTDALGSEAQRRFERGESVDVVQQDHDFILKLARACQEILDSGPVDESTKQAVRERLTVAATTQTTAN